MITNSEVMPPVEANRIIEYRVDGGWVNSEQTEVINDQGELQKIALASVKPYSDLIASMRFDEPWNSCTDEVLGNLFFLTDISTKRNEFFESFDAFCGAQLIKQKIAGRKINEVYVIGTRIFREDTLRSLAPYAQIKLLGTSKLFYLFPKLFLQNVHYCFKFLFISILAPILIRRGDRGSGKKRFFVTRFPGRLSTNENEQKYNNIVRPQDYFLASLLTDGLHQNLSLAGWILNARKSNKLKRTEIIDRYFSPFDSVLCFFKTAKLIRRIKQNNTNHCYKNIAFTEILKEECVRSTLRTARLITISRGFLRLFCSIEQHNQQSSVVYYLHEYAYGRMVTTILKGFCPTLKRIGFQHGPSAKTKLVYMLSAIDLVEETQSLALPQAVLAEDLNSANLYRSSGYKKVSTLSSIPRLASSGNHRFSQIDREMNTSLIATGLHDGLIVMTLMLPIIRSKKNITFLVKLHPKANNKGALAVKLPPNCFWVNEPIEDLFKRVDMVYSSYSSVGIEAEAAGIPVTFIEPPGRVSQKPTSRNN